MGEFADEVGELTVIRVAAGFAAEEGDAFVLNHPAITAAIIGPRTREQLESQLPAADVTLPADVLDRIDEIVPPGINLNPADAGWQHPGLEPAARRR